MSLIQEQAMLVNSKPINKRTRRYSVIRMLMIVYIQIFKVKVLKNNNKPKYNKFSLLNSTLLCWY